MRVKDISKSLVIISLLLPLFLLPSSFGQTETFIVIPSLKVQIIAPGQDLVPIGFNITTTQTVYEITITPVSSTYFTPSFKGQNVTLQELQAGSWFNKTVFFYNVSPNAPIGYDAVSINISYVTSSGQKTHQIISVPVPVLGFSKFLISAVWGSPSSPLIVGPGSSNVPLTLVVVNEGNSPAYNVTITLSNTQYITFLTPTVELGYLPVGTPVQGVAYASVSSSASPGVYQVPVQITYNNGLKVSTTVNVDVMGVTSIQVLAIWGTPSNPMVVMPGQQNVPLTIMVKNLGTTTLYNVSVTIDSNSVIQPSTYTVQIGDVPAGEVNYATIVASVSSSVGQGVYDVPITVTYNGQYSQSLEMQIEILGYSQVTAIGVWGSPSNPIQVAPGVTNYPLTIVLVNAGTGTITNATLQLQDTQYVKFSQTSLTVGALPPGTPVDVMTVASLAPNTPIGVLNVPAKLQYFNGVTQQITVQIPVNGQLNFSVLSVWGSTSDPIVVAPGMQRVPLVLVIKNLGDVNALNVTVQVEPNEYPVQFLETTGQVGIVPAGGFNEVTLLANVYPNVSLGVYYIPVTLNYYSTKVTVQVPVYVTGYFDIVAQAFWGTQSSPTLASPGVTNLPLTIVLVNTGTSPITNATLYLPQKGPIYFSMPYITVGALPVGSPVQLLTYASVSPNVKPGVYYVNATLQYYNGLKTQVTIPVAVTGYQFFQVQTVWGSASSPITASPGQNDVPLTIIIRNLGDVNMQNVTLYFTGNEYPLQVSQKVVGFGIIPAGLYSEAMVTVNVFPNATPGTYYVQAMLSNYGYNETVSIPVTIYGPSIAVNLVTNPPAIFQGYTLAQLIVVVTNYGEGYAMNANVTISTPLEVVGQNTFQLGAIPPGRPLNVTYVISVPSNFTPGKYPVTVRVEYDGGSYTKTFDVTIKPEAKIVVTGVYSSLTSGASQVPLTLTIKNEGNVTAKNLILTLGSNNYIYPYVSSSNPLMGLTASRYFVGDLAPGQEVNVTFIVDVSNVPPGSYPITLIAVWNQTQSVYPFESSITVKVPVQPTLGQLLLEPPYVYGIIATIILVIVLLTLAGMRRRKKAT